MNIALYVRVSTQEQAEEGYSINGQINSLKDYCKSRNYNVVEVYQDEGISGKSLDRPELNRLLRDCETNNFDMIMVWKISRLSRKQVDFLNIIDAFERHGKSFFSYSENIDQSTPSGRAMLQMMGSFAELERNITLENLKLGMTQRAKEGKWNGGNMLGYKSLDKKLVIVEHEAKIVRHIFNLYTEGKGYKAIAHQLNYEGYKTKRNKDFSINSIRTIVMNPAYAGYLRFNQVENWNEQRRRGKNENYILVEGQHTPIITRRTWDKAQAMLEKKSHKPAKTFTGHFPLTTLLRCPKCGQGMIGHKAKRSKSSKDYIRYYQCGNFHYKGRAVCNSNLLNADEVEKVVFNKLQEVSSNPSTLQAIVNNVNKKIAKLKEPLQNHIDYTHQRLEGITKTIERFLKVIEDTEHPPISIMDKISSLENEKKLLITKKKETEMELTKPTVSEVNFKEVHNILKVFNKVLPKVAPDKQKELLHSIINKITVYEGNSPKERSIKEIELFFDASIKDDFVLTYGTAHSS